MGVPWFASVTRGGGSVTAEEPALAPMPAGSLAGGRLPHHSGFARPPLSSPSPTAAIAFTTSAGVPAVPSMELAIAAAVTPAVVREMTAVG